MINTLLQTKLYIPPTRTTIVPRSRLIEQLSKGLNGKLTLVSAPAGFGKTTLVTDWLLQLERSIAWVSLDEDDSDPQQFFNYVAEAIRSLSTDLQTLTNLLQAPQPQPAKALATALINDYTAVSTPCLLVLDDYHEVESAEIDLALAFLLDHMPPNLHLVMTSRSDPGFPLSRLRARNQLTEIRAEDLRFSTEETAVFLQTVMGITLSPEQIAALEARTEGWVAGLQMAALAMHNQDDVDTFVTSFTGSHRFIMDYLVEEVLNQQPSKVQDFLLETAVLTRLSSDLCDAVRQSPPAGQQILEQLENDNIFLIPLDNERRWYRYHHLFADLLRNRLAQTRPGLVPQLHQRASDWYAENGRSNDAVRHALSANDFERAARHIELAADQMDLTNQLDPWQQWVEVLPDSVVRLRPVLLVSYAWAHLIFNSELDACEQRLQEAERWLNLSEAEREALGMVVFDEERFKMLPVSIASARTYAARAAGDMVGAVKHAQQALDLLPEDDHLGRALPASLLGLCYFASGKLSSAFEALNASFAGFRKGGNILAAISIKLVLADIQMVQGRLHDARQTCEQALQLASTQGGLNLRGTANLLLSLSEIHCEQGDSKTAADYLQQIDTLSEQASSSNYQYRKRVALAHMKTNQGNFAEANNLLDEAAPWLGQVHLRETRPLAAIKAHVWLKQGRLDKALAWANKRGISIDDELSYLHEFDYMTLARLLIAQHQNTHDDDTIHQAVRLLARLLQLAEAEKRMGSIIKILILQALAQEAQNNIASALNPLTQALTQARPENYVRIFVDEGPAMAMLLLEAMARGIMPDYCGKLLAVFEAEGQKIEHKPDLPPTQPLIDPLSARELEILTHIATGLRNKEIADTLFVSINTVHYHTKNIYSKLGVNSRTKAVTKARELNLLE